jgi:hypothetical protein
MAFAINNGETTMSAAHVYMIRTLLKALGVDASELELKVAEAQKVIVEFDLDQLRQALRMILDYQENQAQINSRLIAIMNHLGIVDPALIAQLAITQQEGNDDNG